MVCVLLISKHHAVKKVELLNIEIGRNGIGVKFISLTSQYVFWHGRKRALEITLRSYRKVLATDKVK